MTALLQQVRHAAALAIEGNIREIQSITIAAAEEKLAREQRESAVANESERRTKASCFWTRLNRMGQSRPSFYEGHDLLGHGALVTEKSLKEWLGATPDEMAAFSSGAVPERWWQVLKSDLRDLAGIKRP
jgi:hypothetical protein